MYAIICIIIMCVATYIPRALPICLINKEIKSTFIKSFLYYVPYAVLSSLTFPAIFYTCNNMYIALVGTMTAIILSFLKQKMIIVVIATVLIVFLLSFI